MTPETVSMLMSLGTFLLGAAVHAKFPFLTWLSGQRPGLAPVIKTAESGLANLAGQPSPALASPASALSHPVLTRLEALFPKLESFLNAATPSTPAAPAPSTSDGRLTDFEQQGLSFLYSLMQQLAANATNAPKLPNPAPVVVAPAAPAVASPAAHS